LHLKHETMRHHKVLFNWWYWIVARWNVMSWGGVKEINDQNSTKMYTIVKPWQNSIFGPMVSCQNDQWDAHAVLCHNELYLCAYLFRFHLP
jgi:hypothetical protein